MTTTTSSSTDTRHDGGDTAPQQVSLVIGGMTCASCAARVEKKLNKLDGVTASVNYATEQAQVTYPANVTAEQLIATVEATGYTAQLPHPAAGDDDGPGQGSGGDGTSDPTRLLRDRLIGSAVLAAPVIVLAMVPATQFRNWQWLALMLAFPVVAWGAWPFHKAAFTNLRHGAATMDTLVSLGVLAAFGWSLYALFIGDAGMTGMKMSFAFTIGQTSGHEEIYLEAAAGVTVFLLAGRYFEARAKRRSGAALQALLSLGAKDVALLRDGVESRVPVDQLAVGDSFIVRPGEKIATDGTVLEGSGAIDTSLLTGESVPVEVTPGDAVTGATVNVGGRLIIEATRIGSDTQLAQMAKLVTDAQNGKAPVQRLADRIAAVFVPVVIAISIATLGFWLGTGGSVTAAFTAAVAVLIIACPCALGLATPTALLVGTGRGAQLGILIKGPQVLESTRRVDTIVLDKTGTVTTGQMSLHQVIAADGEDCDQVLRLAGALEDASEHPIARAIATAAIERTGPLLTVEDFANLEGLGVQGVVDGHAVLVGRTSLLQQWSQHLTPGLAQAKADAEAEGRTAVAVGWDGAARGILVVADTIKPTSTEAITRLRALGLRPMLLTGDNTAAAQAVAATVGIDPGDVIAEVLPHDKLDVITRLQGEGKVVAMVGDGVNDAAALAQADLGLAVGTGTDVAIEASDLTLVRGDLRAAADAIRLSRRTLGTIKGNLFWAFAYNIAAIPVAATGFLNPMIAGAAMAFSSVFVVSNSLRLRRFHADTDTPHATTGPGSH